MGVLSREGYTARMTMTGSEKLIRDPLWETIRLDPTAVRIVDTAEFQRLRYICLLYTSDAADE